MHDWDQILAEFGPLVWRQVFHLLGNDADAADCFQEVMLQSFQLTQRQPVQNWRGLLKRIAVTRALDRLRQRYRGRHDTRPLSELESTAPNIAVSESLEQAELAERLRIALARLPPNQAEVFTLRCIEDLSADEVAERLQTTTGNVGVLLHRARTTLRQWLSDGEEVTHE